MPRLEVSGQAQRVRDDRWSDTRGSRWWPSASVRGFLLLFPKTVPVPHRQVHLGTIHPERRLCCAALRIIRDIAV